MVWWVEAAGDPGLGHTHGVQHRVGPQPVRRVPDVVQGPVSWVVAVIAEQNTVNWGVNEHDKAGENYYVNIYVNINT